MQKIIQNFQVKSTGIMFSAELSYSLALSDTVRCISHNKMNLYTNLGNSGQVFQFYFNSYALHLLIISFTTITNIRLSKLFILIFSVYHNIPFGGL